MDIIGVKFGTAEGMMNVTAERDTDSVTARVLNIVGLSDTSYSVDYKTILACNLVYIFVCFRLCQRHLVRVSRSLIEDLPNITHQ